MSLEFSEKNFDKTPASQELHNEFMKPLDESRILDCFTDEKAGVTDSEPDSQMMELYDLKLPNNLDYRIEGKIARSNGKNVLGKKIQFFLLDEEEHSAVSTLAFKKTKKEGEDGSFYNMHHRLIDSKEMDISGTDFLQKSEEFFKILKENGLLEENTIGCGVSQVSVYKFLVKNGFKLNSNTKVKAEDIFNPTTGEIVNPEYEFIDVFDSENNIQKDPYLVKKDFINDPDFKGKWQDYIKYDKDGKMFIQFLGGERRPEGHIVDNLIDKGYMPRFYFEKEI